MPTYWMPSRKRHVAFRSAGFQPAISPKEEPADGSAPGAIELLRLTSLWGVIWGRVAAHPGRRVLKSWSPRPATTTSACNYDKGGRAMDLAEVFDILFLIGRIS